MTGTWLRGPQYDGHRCDLDDPSAAEVGSVWRCGCGRRWVIRLHWDGKYHKQVWRRRRLPWPRRSAAEKAGVQTWLIDSETGTAKPPPRKP